MEALRIMMNKNSFWFKYAKVVCISLIFFGLINLGQYIFGFGIESESGWVAHYGIPSPYYEEYIRHMEGGRIREGIIVNPLFAIIVGLLIARIFLVQKKSS